MAGIQQEQIVSQSEAARLAGVSRQRIYQMLALGSLRGVRLQGRDYVAMASLRDYFRARDARSSSGGIYIAGTGEDDK